jgi:rhodanese-related sulfurtransferase
MPHSLVLEFQVAERSVAREYFGAKLAAETDPSDVHADLEAGVQGFVVLDARPSGAYALEHVPGAISFPHRAMDAESTAVLPKDELIVVYCDGIGCNASTKAALKLTALGFKVKEMLGGLDWWKRDGYTVASGPAREAVPAREAEAAGPGCGC